MTNSKSPLIHVKAIKTKYFQVDIMQLMTAQFPAIQYRHRSVTHKAKGVVKIW